MLRSHIPQVRSQFLTERDFNYVYAEIQAIQRLVGANPDGNYGKETAQRVFDWQHQFGSGLIDGIVGLETFRDMFPGKIPSGLQQNSSSSTATDDTSTESKPAPTTEQLPSQSTSTE